MNYCNRINSTKDCKIVVNDELKEGYIYVYILLRNYIDGKRSNQYIIKDNEDYAVFDFSEDGYYTLCTLTISTNPSSEYYYKDGAFYKGIYEVGILDLIDNVEGDYQEYFHLCHLKKCYINLCQDIFDKTASINCSSNSKVDTYKRDLVWATINVIEYMTEIDLYYEAERLLLRVTGCNGICENSISNCGCDLMRM